MMRKAFLLFGLILLFSVERSLAAGACPGGIQQQNDVIKQVPTEEGIESHLANTTGKCYKITLAEFVYLIDRNHAIYRVPTDDFANPLMLFDFGGSKVKHEIFAGVVKGIGKYSYKDGRGIPRKMPRMAVIKESKVEE